MDTIELNNGISIPQLGIGTYRISPDDAQRSVKHALDTGYRLIDTANIYMNEKAVGRAIKESEIHRTDVFLTTKLWPSSFSFAKAKEAIDASLNRLGVDYLDLVLLHQPVGAINQAWRALEEAIDEGKVRAIGVSNFTQKDLEKLLESTDVVPVVNQVECHPYFQQRELKEFMKTNNIALEAWYPLGSGSPELFAEPILTALAQKYSKSVVQIILRWHVQSGHIVIPGSKNLSHIDKNLDIFDFDLTDDEIALIGTLDRDKELAGMPRIVRRLIGLARPDFNAQPQLKR
ncbi:aldo/keto reductase [Alloscardovia theropitheci]|uniref:Aldo/keto reductase n=2 Tax=Alloscardovia theropitheci TaxID=2496842 RepID=A0A4R0QSB9_9BIFI|nr:aldo/keto reductase [Alloscardovia theropitheci]